MLLLGIAESGKSTLFKAIGSIHKIVDKQKLEIDLSLIKLTIMFTMKTILDSMLKTDSKFEELNEVLLKKLKISRLFIMDNYNCTADEMKSFTPLFLSHIECLWKDKNVTTEIKKLTKIKVSYALLLI